MSDIKSTNNLLASNLQDILKRFDDIQLSNDDTNEIEEWLKCKEDFFHFLRKYVKLDLPGNDNEFRYHRGQELVIRTLIEHHYAIVNKSRQIGVTTVIRAYCAWLTIFYSNYSIGVISKKGPDATAFVRKTIKVIEELPEFLQPTFEKKTEQQYILSNGSLLMAEAVSPSQPENALRSNPIVFLIIDEGAFIHKIKDALSGLLPTTVTVQKAAKYAGIPYGVLMISTPNKTQGTGEWFFNHYKQAVLNNGFGDDQSTGTYKAIRLHWKDLGEPFDEEWYSSQCKVLNYNKEDIAQEVDCVFIPLVKNGLIEKDQLIDLSNNSKEPAYKIKTDRGGDIYVFDKTLSDTRHERRFVMSVDTATSSGMATFSSFVAIDYDTNEQVMEYVGKLSIYDYPNVVKRGLEELGDNVFIIPERNTIGESVVYALKDDKRWSSKIFYTITKDKSGRVTKKVPGIETHGQSKPLFIEAVGDFFKNNLTKIYGERTILQIASTDVLDGKLVGTPNDLIMCYAFIAYCKKNNLIRFVALHLKEGDYVMQSDLEGSTKEEIIDYLYDRNHGLREKINKKRNNIFVNDLDWLNRS